MPLDMCQKLTLGDTESGDTVEVVAHLNDMSYPLALTPGTRVRLHKVEQRHVDKRYQCRVIVASQVSVVTLSSPDRTQGSIPSYINHSFI